MAQEKKCERPGCTGTLIKLEHESTWTVEKYYCSNRSCGRVYAIPTTTGKLAQLAPLALIGGVAWGVLTQDWSHVVDHLDDVLDHPFG